MKNIVLIRHAKSSWEFSVSDFERPLLQKGIDNSYKVAEVAQNYFTENALIWVSSAKRTQETAKIFMPFFKVNTKNINVRKDLYTISLTELEQIVKSCSNDYNFLILFGHNNAITDFVNKFGDVFIDNVPTSGLVSITFDTDCWSTISNGTTDKIIFPSHL